MPDTASIPALTCNVTPLVHEIARPCLARHSVARVQGSTGSLFLPSHSVRRWSDQEVWVHLESVMACIYSIASVVCLVQGTGSVQLYGTAWHASLMVDCLYRPNYADKHNMLPALCASVSNPLHSTTSEPPSPSKTRWAMSTRYGSPTSASTPASCFSMLMTEAPVNRPRQPLEADSSSYQRTESPSTSCGHGSGHGPTAASGA